MKPSEATQDKSEFPRTRALLLGLLIAAGAPICVATLFGFAGRWWWVFDLFSHFRVQYFLSMLPILLALLLGKWFRTSAVFGLFAVLNLACILPYYLPSSPASNDSGRVLRAVSINVNTPNEQYDLVKQFIFEQSPDLILLTEVNAAWLKAMDEIHSQYPFQHSQSREDNFGIVLYSKLPFTQSETLYLGQAEMPSVVAEIDVEGRRLTIVGTHTLPPIDDVYTELRNDQLAAVAEYLASVYGPKILLGDLNASPWSYCFGRLLGRANMVDSSKGRGIEPTWPTHLFWMRIPIDFCLISPEITIRDKRVGLHIGSDHFPLIVDFSLAAEPTGL